MAAPFDISKRFTFDAAHQLACNVPASHRYAGVHGHSFEVEVHVRGEKDPATGWVMDFAELEALIAPLRDKLDHAYLNDIPGLEVPTLENICQWLWERLIGGAPQLSHIIVRRGSYGEACTYHGPGK
jgi:6-pyruvoyltetrahydropterin/6-carboxytetrahydropterin synthase